MWSDIKLSLLNAVKERKLAVQVFLVNIRIRYIGFAFRLTEKVQCEKGTG